MTVRELIDELNRVEDKTRVVVLQGDPEGNYYRRLEAAWTDAAVNGRGEVGFEALTPELEAEGYDEYDVVKGQPAVVLLPEEQ